MGRKSNAQKELEAQMAQEGAQEGEPVEQVESIVEEPVVVPTAKETASKTIPAEAHWAVVNPPSDSLREQNISEEERQTLIRMRIKQILDTDRTQSLPGVRVRTLLRCPTTVEGLQTMHILMDVDVRVIDRVKEYYFDNATDPSPAKLLYIIEDIIGHTSPYYPRVVTRDWS